MLPQADKGRAQPLTALAVGTVCFPLGSFTVFCLAPPVLAVDAFMHVAKDTPIGHTIEHAAAEGIEVAKLWFLVGKVTAKQSIRFAQKEIKRTG